MIMRSRFVLGVASIYAAAALSPAVQADPIPPALAAKRASALSGVIPSPLGLIFTPIKPCTAFDTTKATKLTAGQIKPFYVSGTAGFPQQGGTGGGCGVPASATAVALSLTAINATSAGFLTAFGAKPRPEVRSVSYASNAPSTAGVTAEIKDGRTLIYSDRAADVIGAVTGYYEPQIWAYISIDGTTGSQSGRITASRKQDVGLYVLTIDRDVSDCFVTVSSELGPITMAAFGSGNTVLVNGYDRTGAAHDNYFNVFVSC